MGYGGIVVVLGFSDCNRLLALAAGFFYEAILEIRMQYDRENMKPSGLTKYK